MCWVTRAMTTLHVQNIHGGVETRRCVKFMEVVERNGLPISNEDVSNAMLRIQVGEEVLTVTLNCYDDVDDDDGSGRRA